MIELFKYLEKRKLNRLAGSRTNPTVLMMPALIPSILLPIYQAKRTKFQSFVMAAHQQHHHKNHIRSTESS